MLFKNKQELVLVSIKKGTSKKGNDLKFVKVADPLTYESEQFLLSSESEDNFKTGQKVELSLIVENGFTNAIIIPAK